MFDGRTYSDCVSLGRKAFGCDEGHMYIYIYTYTYRIHIMILRILIYSVQYFVYNVALGSTLGAIAPTNPKYIYI